MQLLNHAHVEFIIDDERMTGWADEESPVEFPDGAGRAEFKTGADGGVYGVGKAMFGGAVVMKFAPTSPSVQYWIQRNEEYKQTQINGERTRIYSGSYSDSVQGRSARCEGGALMDCPDMSTPGVTFEVTIFYERIIGNVDGAVFHPPLTSDST